MLAEMTRPAVAPRITPRTIIQFMLPGEQHPTPHRQEQLTRIYSSLGGAPRDDAEWLASIGYDVPIKPEPMPEGAWPDAGKTVWLPAKTNTLVTAVETLMRGRQKWSGTRAELHSALRAVMSDEHTDPSWDSAAGLCKALLEAEATLHKFGLRLTRPRSKNNIKPCGQWHVEWRWPWEGRAVAVARACA